MSAVASRTVVVRLVFVNNPVSKEGLISKEERERIKKCADRLQKD